MPRERITTDAGYIELQWSRGGQLVCLVSSDGDTETMHQFTEPDDLAPILKSGRRANRQAFEDHKLSSRCLCNPTTITVAKGLDARQVADAIALKARRH